ncbi:cation:proton antiporter [Butyricicoccus pullicaecorum]|uniref:Potassium transporter n=1 Tax=Butyricicoccus pullicaecorum TaxID=501571 RepID=A0A1Y4LLN3_9FIRM|nr:cation:proton antiporter [Butyricicoccus pullicaecorum]OUP57623.1 potassium transporter [Butyricicoccus pullicaecorum]
MLWSLALVFLGGLLAGEVFRRLRLPPLLGMLLVGIAFGPYALGLLDDSLLAISADLRKIALIIILTRAGLSLDIGDLRKVGRSAVLLCFVPATFEIVGTVILAPRLLGVSVLEAAIIGSVIAAVSPAVVVPRMLRLMDEGYGSGQGIPQMILAGASVDDVYVIVLFSSFTSLASGGTLSPLDFVRIPTSLVLGIAAGVLCGLALAWWFSHVHMRDSIKVVIFLALSLVLVTIEDHCTGIIGFSGLLAVMSMGIMLGRRIPVVSKRLSAKYDRLWVGAELLLFVLVGAMVNVAYVAYAGVAAILLILGAMVFRMAGVFASVLSTKLNGKERAFCMLAYTPKATVQAAIGGVPLAMGLACGETVLTVAVLAILITAPFGAIAIDCTYKKWLQRAK